MSDAGRRALLVISTLVLVATALLLLARRSDDTDKEPTSGERAPTESAPSAETADRERGPATAERASNERLPQSRQMAFIEGCAETEPPRPSGSAPAFCGATQRPSDALQDELYARYVGRRENRQPLEARQAEELGAIFVQQLDTDDSSPYRGRIDRPADAEFRAYIEKVARPFIALMEREGLRVTIHTANQAIPNAVALPGGQVIVHTGLVGRDGLANNEAQLAGVLAHELGHIDLRHTEAMLELIRDVVEGQESPDGRRWADVAILALRAGYSSELEDEADRYAVDRMFAVGYSPWQYEDAWVSAYDRFDRATEPAPAPPVDDEASMRRWLRDELRNLTRSHNNGQVRACEARAQIEAHPSVRSRELYCVGATNLQRRDPWRE